MRLVLILLLLGCGGGPPVVPDAGVLPDAGPGLAPCEPGFEPIELASGVSSRCIASYVLDGLAVRWEDRPHALARWGARPVLADGIPTGCQPGAELRGVTESVVLGGGNGALGSTANASVYYQVLQLGDPIVVTRGQAIVDLDGMEGTGSALVDLEATGLSDAVALGVVIDGFGFETDVPQGPMFPSTYLPSEGYATREIGAWITEARVEGTDLRVGVGAVFTPGTDADPMRSAAARQARTRATVHFAVYGVSAPPSRAQVSYRVQSQAVTDDDHIVCRPPETAQQIAITGMPGLARGFTCAGAHLALLIEMTGERKPQPNLPLVRRQRERERRGALGGMAVDEHRSSRRLRDHLQNRRRGLARLLGDRRW
jgi:hypothetical protein